MIPLMNPQTSSSTSSLFFRLLKQDNSFISFSLSTCDQSITTSSPIIVPMLHNAVQYCFAMLSIRFCVKIVAYTAKKTILCILGFLVNVSFRELYKNSVTTSNEIVITKVSCKKILILINLKFK